MNKQRTRVRIVAGLIAILVSAVVFLVPFAFIVLTAVKTRQEAALLDLGWPQQFAIVENFVAVIQARDLLLVTAFVNSFMHTSRVMGPNTEGPWRTSRISPSQRERRCNTWLIK